MENNPISKISPRPLQLLAPARDLPTARQAILHGADAVYIGAESFGARSRAGNSIEDIRNLVRFATPYNVRVYVTLNTIIYDHELADVEQLVWQLYHAGVDALIVQDLGLLELNLPPIALHASTQCDTRDAEKARFLRDLGFSQIVIARETSLPQIAEIVRAAAPASIEAFVHGALCVSYSGDCQASWVATGRSANRGECAQMCRLPYDLIDGQGNVVGQSRHYLSLRDLNRIDSLGRMADAGVSSFKIEGRLKDIAYVKNVVAAYRGALDRVIAANPDRYCRASRGECRISFTPDLNKAFNRSFTDYFLDSANPSKPMASLNTPKSLGEPIGKALTVKGSVIKANLFTPINNGDGITFINPDGSAGGFRVNRAEGNQLFLLENDSAVKPQARLYRNFDRLMEDILSREPAIRNIPVDFSLRPVAPDRLELSGLIEDVGKISTTIVADLQPARTPDSGRTLTAIAKLGDTPFELRHFHNSASELFIPASIATSLRRQWVDVALSTLAAVKRPERNLSRAENPSIPANHHFSRHDNIANSRAANLISSLTSLPASKIERATECDAANRRQSDIRVMTTRYCLRRELGACLRQGGAQRLPGPLFLQGKGLTYRLDFDCPNCRMHLIANPSNPPKKNNN